MDDISPPQDMNAAQRRIRLSAKARRAQILDAAQALFFGQGWDAVTVGDILKEAGISKGGFYHHFAAKEDLLDGLVERLTLEAHRAAEAVHAHASGDALARFNAFLAESIRWKAERGPEMRFLAGVMLRPGNDVLFHRITTAANAAAAPLLAQMLADGVIEGCFDVAETALTAETILNLGHGRRAILRAAIRKAEAGEIDAATDLLNARMSAEGTVLDRLLGLPPDSICLASAENYRRMLIAMIGG